MSPVIVLLIFGIVAAIVLAIGAGILILVLFGTRGLGKGSASLVQVVGMRVLLKPQIHFGKKYLLTRTEAAFYRELIRAVRDDFIVMSKVRLADLLEVRAKGREWGYAFNRLCRKHVDFVLLDSRDLSVRLAIELDDPSHEREESQRSDAHKDEVFREGGIALLRVKAASTYNPVQLAERIQQTTRTGPVAMR